jgi:hypothetical protein
MTVHAFTDTIITVVVCIVLLVVGRTLGIPPVGLFIGALLIGLLWGISIGSRTSK